MWVERCREEEGGGGNAGRSHDKFIFLGNDEVYTSACRSRRRRRIRSRGAADVRGKEDEDEEQRRNGKMRRSATRPAVLC
eukprot:532135-Hanusia_phi.AAC.2